MQILMATVTLREDTYQQMVEKSYDPIGALALELDIQWTDCSRCIGQTESTLSTVFCADVVSVEMLCRSITDFLLKKYKLEKDTYRLTVAPAERGTIPREFYDALASLEARGVYIPWDEPTNPTKAVKKERRTMELDEKMEGVRAKIQALVGALEFKALCDELFTVSSELRRNQTAKCLMHQTYLFSINDGYGYTTALAYLRELYLSFDFMKMSPYGKVEEMKLQEVSALVPDPFAAIYETLDEGNETLVRILSIDISEWISQTGKAEFKTFLRRVAKATGFIIVFRVPFLDKEVLATIRDALNDIMFVRTVSFPPLTKKENRAVATAELVRMGFRMSPAAWELFDEKIAEEKSDGRFYGINTVHKVVWELLYQKQLTNAKRGVSDSVIGKQDMRKICKGQSKEKSAEEMLASLVGAETIAGRINEIISQIMLARKQSLRPPCIHMRFVGNPGTGKTTVARIIGKLLKEKGVLRIGSFYEYAGRDLVGRYIGETAPRTSGICRDAYGSVLFIDEAYSLYRGPDDQRDFGREALDTLVAEMENHRSDLVVIMAGYTDDMETMMKGNAGLASRMPYTVEFPNFTRNELYRIFESMAKRDFTCDEELLCAAREYFNALPDSMINAKEFSNGRFVRNLYERVWAKAALRCQMESSDEIVLKRIDFELSCADGEFNVMNQKKKKPIGFMP